MLVIWLKKGTLLKIGAVTVKVHDDNRTEQVKIAIDEPKEIRIDRVIEEKKVA